MNRVIYILLLLLATLTCAAQPLTLERCLRLAEKNNRELQEARLEIDKAEEVRKGAFTKYFPQVEAMGGGFYALRPLFVYGIDDIENQEVREALKTFFSEHGADLGLKSDIELFKKNYTISASAVQPVFFGGQIYNGNRLAELNTQAQQLRWQIARRQTLQQVEEQYWLVMSLREKRKTLAKAFELIDTTQHVLDAATEAGLRLPADGLRLAARRQQLLQQQLQLTHGIHLATRALALSIGLDSITMPDTLNMVIDDNITGPDYSAREEQQLLTLDVRAQELKKLMEIGKSLPQIAVGASYSYSDVTRYGHNGVFFATVRVPLTQWWESSHKIREQNINIAQAQLRQKDLGDKLRLAQLQKYYKLVEAREQLRGSETLISNAKETYRLTLLNYEAGLATMSELLEAQTLLTDAQTQQVDNYITYRLALREMK